MLIRSQDKKILINLNTLNHIRVSTGKYEDVTVSRIYVESGIVSSNMPIAEYSTEAKAIKVLDKICEKAKCIAESNFFGKEDAYYENPIFQMPSDEEAEGQS